MKRLMQIMFLSCLKATELIEKNLHFKLNIKEKLQLKVHKMMCTACTNYEVQSNLLEDGLEKIFKPLNPTSNVDTQQLKTDILKKLEVNE